LIITHATDFGHFTFGGKTNRAEGSFCPTKSDDDFVPSYETRSVSEDIQVLQMHRGSLSSINREQRNKTGLALAAASNVQNEPDGSNER